MSYAAGLLQNYLQSEVGGTRLIVAPIAARISLRWCYAGKNVKRTSQKKQDAC